MHAHIQMKILSRGQKAHEGHNIKSSQGKMSTWKGIPCSPDRSGRHNQDENGTWRIHTVRDKIITANIYTT